MDEPSHVYNLNRDKLTFLFNSINDMQGVIRAADTKLNVIIVFLILPLTKLDNIYAHIKILLQSQTHPFSAILLVVSFLSFWGIALVTTLRGLTSIDNPSRHIEGSDKLRGTYFGGALFRFSLMDALFNRQHVRASKDIEEVLKDLPKSQEELIRELTYEQMKLGYIRGIKITRQRYAYFFLFCWLLIGGIIWIMSL